MTSNEYAPLAQQDHEVYYVEQPDDSIFPEFMQKNKGLRYGLFSLAGLLVFLLLYTMLIWLPSLQPEGVQIPNIPMVGELDVYLHPIISPKVKGKNPDPDDPVKVIPDFKNLQYVPDSSKLLQDHLHKLSNITDITNKERKKRLILIGDVHGSLTPLKNFLKHVKYDGGKEDLVLLLGDFINKGPDSIGVIEYAMNNNIECILGNHELAMFKRYIQLHSIKKPKFINHDENANSTISTKESYDLDSLMKIAKKITPKHIDFLTTCNPIKKLGPVPHYFNKRQSHLAPYPANGVAAHAGLLWWKDINHQNIDDVSTMRNLLPPDWKKATDDRHDKVDGVKSIAWTKVWNKHQQELYENEQSDADENTFTIGTKVFYGHDAKRGVVTKEFSNGLDSGCVYGEQLTGTIIWAQVSTSKDTKEDSIVYKQMTVNVNCD